MQTLKWVGSFFEKVDLLSNFAGHWHLVHDRCAKHPQHVKHAFSRGSGGMPPQENFEN